MRPFFASLVLGLSFIFVAPIDVVALEVGKLNPVDREVPKFTFKTMDGSSYTREHLAGKPIIVNFWATWCAPCRKEMPSLNRAWSVVEGEGIDMLAINLGDTVGSINEFMQEVPIDFPVVISTNPSDLNAWGVRGLPTTVVLNAEGKIVMKLVGPAEWDEDELLDRVRALL